jgi:aryl-alcohol dehydrogenase-like predicted oxidoreductase
LTVAWTVLPFYNNAVPHQKNYQQKWIETMEYRQLGRAGLRVSALALGSMTFGASETFMKGVTSTDEEARRIFDTALDLGVNLVDTANVYSEGRSEELLGLWMQGKRDKIVLATKCRFPIGFGLKPTGPNDHGISRKHIIEACEASMRRLRTDYLDLYQMHMQDRSVYIEETLRALDDLVRQGKVRYVGCSNYTGYRVVESLWAAERRNTERYESVQMQWSLLVRDAEREVIPACRTFGLGVLVWGALARGFLSGKYKRNQPQPSGSRLDSWKDSWKTMNVEHSWKIIEEVERIAKNHDATPGAISTAWLLHQPEVSSVIVGAREKKQLEEDFTALKIKLSPEELKQLDQVSQPEGGWGYPYNFIKAREPW